MSGISLIFLPCELIWLIIEDLASEKALNMLSQANHQYYEALSPYRYEYNARYGNASALLWAATHGLLMIAKKSLQYGAYAKGTIIKDPSGYTPLSLASKNGHEAIVKLLLASIPNLLRPDWDDTEISLTKAAKHGRVGVVNQFLTWEGFKPVDIEHQGGLALMTAVRYRQEEAIKVLLADGRIDPNFVEDGDMTPLWAATCEDDTDMMKLLLQDHRVDVNIRFSYGRTYLTEAIRNCWHESVEALLNHSNTDINFQEGWGMTPLLVAVITRQPDIVKTLLAWDEVRLDLEDRDGDAPLSLAVNRGYTDIVELLDTKIKSLNSRPKTTSALEFETRSQDRVDTAIPRSSS